MEGELRSLLRLKTWGTADGEGDEQPYAREMGKSPLSPRTAWPLRQAGHAQLIDQSESELGASPAAQRPQPTPMHRGPTRAQLDRSRTASTRAARRGRTARALPNGSPRVRPAHPCHWDAADVSIEGAAISQKGAGGLPMIERAAVVGWLSMTASHLRRHRHRKLVSHREIRAEASFACPEHHGNGPHPGVRKPRGPGDP